MRLGLPDYFIHPQILISTDWKPEFYRYHWRIREEGGSWTRWHNRWVKNGKKYPAVKVEILFEEYKHVNFWNMNGARCRNVRGKRPAKRLQVNEFAWFLLPAQIRKGREEFLSWANKNIPGDPRATRIAVLTITLTVLCTVTDACWCQYGFKELLFSRTDNESFVKMPPDALSFLPPFLFQYCTFRRNRGLGLTSYISELWELNVTRGQQKLRWDEQAANNTHQSKHHQNQSEGYKLCQELKGSPCMSVCPACVEYSTQSSMMSLHLSYSELQDFVSALFQQLLSTLSALMSDLSQLYLSDQIQTEILHLCIWMLNNVSQGTECPLMPPGPETMRMKL